jgi:nucleoside-diphosphate-sugar epimerase
MANILIVGCGDIGIPLAGQLSSAGHHVWGLRRSTQLAAPIQTIRADVCRPETLQGLAELAVDYVVVTLTPAGFTDQAYQSVYVDGLKNLLAALADPVAIKRLIFVSSTSVYAQGDGQWVTEDSATEASSFSGRRLLEAEQLLADSKVSHSVVRFAGIYGPGRNRLIEQVKSLQGCAPTPELFTNRIHRDDCVGVLAHLISMDQQGQPLQRCYIGVDSEPVPLWTVKQWLAEQLGVDTSQLSRQQEHRRSSKRCSNQRLLASGYQLLYPGYQQGYAQVIAASV